MGSLDATAPATHATVVAKKKRGGGKVHSGTGDNPAMAGLPRAEYETVRRFPGLAGDTLSFNERRRVVGKGRLKGGSVSLSTVRSNKSMMSELTGSAFPDGGAGGPLAAIRKSMLEKKRQGRTLPSLKRRTSVLAAVEVRATSWLEAAKRKVRKAGMNYDRYRDGTALNECFLDYSLTAEEFRVALRRALAVELTYEEANALLVDSDLDGNGSLDGAEFLMMFFKMAQAERKKVADKVQRIREKMGDVEKELREKERKFQLVSDDQVVSGSYGQKDMSRVLRRLASYARTFDILSEDGRRTSSSFQCVLRPAALKEQLLKSFGMKVNKMELGALVAHFDQDGDGEVGGAEFLRAFNVLGTLARKKERRRIEEAVKRRRESGLLQELTLPQLGR